MDFSEGTALEIVERLCSAYGVKTQKALAESIGVPAANVSNWVQRDSVPGSAFVKCALDTGSDLYWLTTGKLANANRKEKVAPVQGKALYNEIMSNGGKPVLRRIMEAYGFTLQKQLCDLLDISSGTVSTWSRRDYFPGDVVVTCALDTGVSLEWLATGKGGAEEHGYSDNSFIKSIRAKRLNGGTLDEDSSVYLSENLLPSKVSYSDLMFVKTNQQTHLINLSSKTISNGLWLIDLDGSLDLYTVSRRPGDKLKLLSQSNEEFNCEAKDIKALGMVVLTLNYTWLN